MKALAAVFAAGLVACCTSSPRPMQDVDPNPGTASSSRGSGATPTDVKEPPVPSVEFTFVSRRREHPPISRIRADVALRNPGAKARWFLLPAGAGSGHSPIATWAFATTVWKFVGTGNVVVAQFSAAGSFYAIQLPPDAEVTLRSLQLLMADEPKTNPMQLEVIVADGFTIGGEVPAVWTKTPATCEPRADATQDGAERLLEEPMPDLKSRPVEVQGAQRMTVSLAFPE